MEGTERPEEVPEITEQSLLGNVPPVNVASVNVADEPEVVEKTRQKIKKTIIRKIRIHLYFIMLNPKKLYIKISKI
jgi:hypothetical protein